MIEMRSHDDTPRRWPGRLRLRSLQPTPAAAGRVPAAPPETEPETEAEDDDDDEIWLGVEAAWVEPERLSS